MNVLIIGASRGLGREFVNQYLADGAKVTATARKPDDVAALEQAGATAFALDIADAASTVGIEWRVDGSGFDIAIVNAGVSGPRTKGLETPSEDDFDQVMHTNVLGPMRVIPQLATVLAPGAKLAVLSSWMGSIGSRTDTTMWTYRASKAALNSVLKDAALTFGGKVTCVAFSPGWVKTDMGGPKATLTSEKSVAGMRATLAKLKPEQSGSFVDHDGSTIAW